jgi:hypothetical protein
MKPVPASCAAAYSDGMECPHCHARLEVAGGTRGVATAAGLLAGWLAWHFSQGSGGALAAVVPEFYAVVAFGIVSGAIVMATANLIPAPPAAEPAPAASHGHAVGHH